MRYKFICVPTFSTHRSVLPVNSEFIRVKFCQLLASLSVVISFVFALKVRLKDLKFEFYQLKLK